MQTGAKLYCVIIPGIHVDKNASRSNAAPQAPQQFPSRRLVQNHVDSLSVGETGDSSFEVWIPLQQDVFRGNPQIQRRLTLLSVAHHRQDHCCFLLLCQLDGKLTDGTSSCLDQ